MAVSPERIKALTEAVATWRLQEYLSIPLHCFYVSVISPQRWNRGKALYMIIRYGVLFSIVIDLVRNYRTYFVITPAVCKSMWVITCITQGLIMITCDFSLGLCLGALLQVQSVLCFVAIILLSCGLQLVNSGFTIAAGVQYQAEPVTALDIELGYPCYAAPGIQFTEKTVGYTKMNIRAYVDLTATTLLAVLGVATLITRYKGQGGRLMQVLRRDGGLHYLSLIAIRVCNVIAYTPSAFLASEVDGSPVWIIVSHIADTIIPILAQRLLINMRKVDYMGSQPVASKLLFAPPLPGFEDNLEASQDSFEMSARPPRSGPQRAADDISRTP